MKPEEFPHKAFYPVSLYRATDFPADGQSESGVAAFLFHDQDQKMGGVTFPPPIVPYFSEFIGTMQPVLAGE
jgi:hypothetical protein